MVKFGLLDEATDCNDASINAVVEDVVSPIKFLRFIIGGNVSLVVNIAQLSC